MSRFDPQRYSKAVVMGYGIRFIHSAFLSIKRGHLKGALSSFSAFRAAMKPIFFTMEHFRFAMVFFNMASTYHMLQRVYDGYVRRRERKMDRNTVRSQLYALQKRRHKIRANVLAAMTSCLWFKRLPTGFRH